MVENNQKGLNLILGGALVLIALFVLIAIVSIRSQATNSTVATSLSIVNDTPSVSSVAITYFAAASGATIATQAAVAAADLSAIDLSANTTKDIFVTANISDKNGFGSDTSTVFSSGNADSDAGDTYVAFAQADKNPVSCTSDATTCYRASFIKSTSTVSSNCQVTEIGTLDSVPTIHISCYYPVQYFANATTGTGANPTYFANAWTATVQTTDSNSQTNSASTTTTMNNLLSTGFTPSINFNTLNTSLKPGDATTAGTPLIFTQQGNLKQNYQVYGSGIFEGAMHCTVGSIPLNDQKISMSNVAYAASTITISSSSVAPTTVPLALTWGTAATPAPTATSYHNVTLPQGIAGSCSGEYTILTVATD